MSEDDILFLENNFVFRLRSFMRRDATSEIEREIQWPVGYTVNNRTALNKLVCMALEGD